MKILGIGVDIIENNRIKKSIQNNKFKTRVYSSNELKLSKNVKNKVAYFSKRFAAKEAFSKALGTGFSENLNFKDIEIVSDKKGKPKYAKNKKIIKIVQKKYKIKKFNSFLSISDEKDYSTAFAIIQSV
ncbi:holo-ACP synthase [Pelagibacterales bacterium SAG-MED18]|jgi:holo-[acyl-carrier protein] synthase|nr:holo-ACP synthase [Pelagibacterales bacterium SAG-MED35]MBD1154888.1 holo-ACP synthase [Pelagibacterales bacterium SAG-MED18]MBD1170451.1 holo-ACP synthase [Pelagibacterales bacterium SAG-MED02]MBD1171471.1 holo-ACP synthase [Pelagibacterales bacterium SAG-MED04]PDH18358.1 MAG: holo-[acyl-carrier-protein] synthase [Pelagibacterales bacterium MED-G39]|tara:strand:+ start:1300 stop:1686 length:387 start_codon:yes stop_codon:yes gene_type:complete